MCHALCHHVSATADGSVLPVRLRFTIASRLFIEAADLFFRASKLALHKQGGLCPKTRWLIIMGSICMYT